MDEQREARSVDWGEVFGGAVAAWFWAALAVTPLVLLGVVLVRRRRGQLVAGVLLGLTLGSILGAGICTTFNLVNMA